MARYDARSRSPVRSYDACNADESGGRHYEDFDQRGRKSDGRLSEDWGKGGRQHDDRSGSQQDDRKQSQYNNKDKSHDDWGERPYADWGKGRHQYDDRGGRQHDDTSGSRDDWGGRQYDDRGGRHDDWGRRQYDDRGNSGGNLRDLSPLRDRQVGIVLWYLDHKGFGFIKPDGGGDELFVHRNQLMDGDVLQQGDEVRFCSKWDEDKKKWRAENVTGCLNIRGGLNGVRGSCWSLENKGHCQYGDHCKYKHSDEATPN